MAAPSALYEPRLVISGTEVDSAWNGIIREKIARNSTTLTTITTVSDTGGRCV